MRKPYGAVAGERLAVVSGPEQNKSAVHIQSEKGSLPTSDRAMRRRGAIKEIVQLDARMEQRAEIRTSPAHLRNLVDLNQFAATVEPTTNGSGTVTSTIMGVVTKILADVGQTVKAGQILAYISCPDLSDAQSNYLNALAKVHEAEAQIELIDTRVNLVKQDVERLRLLNREGITAVKDVQLSEAKLASTLSEKAAAKSMQLAASAHLAATQARLSAFGIRSVDIKDENISNVLPIKSPVSGVITQKSIQAGQMVGPGISNSGSSNSSSSGASQQSYLFTIVNLSKVWVMLEVPQSEVSHLKIGMPILFTSEVAPGRQFKGFVTRLGENFDPKWHTVGVRAEILNPDGVLKPGMFVIAQSLGQREGGSVLVVPNSALQSLHGKHIVFVKTNKHEYRLRHVKLGQRTASFSEVLDGLKAGEPVVSSGAFFVKSEAMRATISGAR